MCVEYVERSEEEGELSREEIRERVGRCLAALYRIALEAGWQFDFEADAWRNPQGEIVRGDERLRVIGEETPIRGGQRLPGSGPGEPRSAHRGDAQAVG